MVGEPKERMKARLYITKTREYLDYLEEHITNVEKAGDKFFNTCTAEGFPGGLTVSDLRILEEKLHAHDISKFSKEEFIQYRKFFYPIDSAEGKTCNEDFQKAWLHHWTHNDHHVEYVAESELELNIKKISILHAIIDWTAMGYKFDDTAREFYESDKCSYEFTDDIKEFAYEVFKIMEK